MTDRDVELLLQLRERDGLGYGRLAVMFELSRSQVRYICTGRSRCQVPVEWRQVRVA